MSEKSKDIIDKLGKAEEEIKKTQKDLGEYQKTIADSGKGLNLTKNFLIEIEKISEIPAPLEDALSIYSTDIYQCSAKLRNYVENGTMGEMVGRIYGATGTAAVTGLSSTPFTATSVPESLIISYDNLESFIRHRSKRPQIYNKLNDIDTNLAAIYNKAWNSLNILSGDEGRDSLFSMREVVTRLYHHLSPDEKVKIFCDLNRIELEKNKNGEEVITRNIRTQYIASKIKDVKERHIFLSAELSYKYVDDSLSYAHAPQKLDFSRVERAIYQADDLILRTLNHLSEVLN